MSSKVFLTGGSGFLALHVLNELLSNGYEVVFTARTDSKASAVMEVVKKLGHDTGKVSSAIVADIAVEGAYDIALKANPEVEFVIHTASPFTMTSEHPYEDIIKPAVQGTLNILKGIKEYAPQVKHVVVTSSAVALYDMRTAGGRPNSYNEKSWNEATSEESIAAGAMFAYFFSKAEAERAFWKFIDEEKPNFQGTTILPPFLFGPVLGDVKSKNALNESSQYLFNVMAGYIPQEFSSYQVDVRDAAKAHVLALKKAVALGQRWSVYATSFTVKDLLTIFKEIPALKNSEIVPIDSKVDSEALKHGLFIIDDSVTRSQMGVGSEWYYRTLDETIKESISAFVERNLV